MNKGLLLQLTHSLTDLMGHRLQITIGMSGHALPINITAASIEHDMGKGKVCYITEGRERVGGREREGAREGPARTVNARTDTRVIMMRPGSDG